MDVREQHLDNDSLAAYAIESLPPNEMAIAAAHLEGCARCRQELADLRETAALLPYGLAMADPPADLRERIVARARESRRRSEPATPSQRAPRRFWRPAWVTPAVAIMALLAGFWLGRAWPGGAPDPARAPGARTIALSGQATGSCIVAPESGQMQLVIIGLPPLAGDQVYQLWLMGQDAPISAGTFTIDQAGRAEVEMTGVAWSPTYTGIAITPEPRGGLPAPSGPIVVQGNF